MPTTGLGSAHGTVKTTITKENGRRQSAMFVGGVEEASRVINEKVRLPKIVEEDR